MSSMSVVDTSFSKTKYYSQPGSIFTKQVDYESKTAAFAAKDVMSDKVKALKVDTLKYKDTKRLGKKPEWNGSTQTIPFTAQRNKMRTLSAYQSEKLDYNFRASQVPQAYKQVIYLPKKNKFDVDEEKFLDPAETKATVKYLNIDPRKEHRRLEEDAKQRMIGSKPDWDHSSEFDHRLYEKKNNTLKTSSTLRSTNTLSQSYLSPIDREKQRQAHNRMIKLEERKRAEEAKLEGEPQVYRIGIREKQLSTALMGSVIRTGLADESDGEEDRFS